MACLKHVFNVTVDHDLTDALNIWSRLHVRGETTPVFRSLKYV